MPGVQDESGQHSNTLLLKDKHSTKPRQLRGPLPSVCPAPLGCPGWVLGIQVLGQVLPPGTLSSLKWPSKPFSDFFFSRFCISSSQHESWFEILIYLTHLLSSPQSASHENSLALFGSQFCLWHSEQHLALGRPLINIYRMNKWMKQRSTEVKISAIKNKMTLPFCLFKSVSVNLYVISLWHFVQYELWKWILKSQLFSSSLRHDANFGF